MSESSNPASLTEAVKAPLGLDEPDAHHGRPASWVCTALVIVGFVIGGVGMVPHPHWVVIWIGAAVVVVGGIWGAAVRIFDDWY